MLTANGRVRASRWTYDRQMRIRRAAWYWLYAEIAVLPAWVLVGWAVWGSGARSFVGVALLTPLLVVGLLAIAVLFSIRSSVRRTKTLTWPDAGVLAAITAGIVGVGFFGPATAWFAVLALGAGIAAFWVGVWELLVEVRQGIRTAFVSMSTPPATKQAPIEAGEYVVLPPASPGHGAQHS